MFSIVFSTCVVVVGVHDLCQEPKLFCFVQFMRKQTEELNKSTPL